MWKQADAHYDDDDDKNNNNKNNTKIIINQIEIEWKNYIIYYIEYGTEKRMKWLLCYF